MQGIECVIPESSSVGNLISKVVWLMVFVEQALGRWAVIYEDTGGALGHCFLYKDRKSNTHYSTARRLWSKALIQPSLQNHKPSRVHAFKLPSGQQFVVVTAKELWMSITCWSWESGLQFLAFKRFSVLVSNYFSRLSLKCSPPNFLYSEWIFQLGWKFPFAYVYSSSKCALCLLYEEQKTKLQVGL